MKRNGVDIIVPVYNALDDLKICLESIKKHTDLSLDRLILINDKSPDQNVLPFLESISEPGIVVLHNEKNCGFSGTVNRGLEFSDRDVLLLNSDTVVTRGWIEKIVACAYSDSAIGTVTPFSNNATLCSIPNFCEENSIPYGLSIDEYAQIIEECSMRKYPRITVAVGFCMFIKRKVVDLVGLFDQETFQKGYGEENDFCWRAEQLGYYHVLCDDTYIFHSGTASFLSAEKKKLIEEHEKVLVERYPKQVKTNAEYVRDNPHQYLRNNVDMYAKLQNGKKNLLYVLHMDFRSDSNDNIGGTQLHVKDLMTHLRKDYNVFVLARDDKMLRLSAYTSDAQMTFKFFVEKKANFQQFHSEAIAKIYREILNAFQIDFVHIHHVVDLSFDVFDITKEMGLPLLLTLHDYYFLCPTIKLLENGSKYCEGNSENCAACLRNQMNYSENISFIALWRKQCLDALNKCDVIVTPSGTAKDLYSAIYPEIAKKIRVIPHGMDAFPSKPVEKWEEATKGFECWIEHAFEGDCHIRGWAIMTDYESEGTEITVRIQDCEGKLGEYRTLTEARPDLAEAKGNNKYLYSGFSARIPDAYFASGKLRYQIVISDGKQRFYSKVMSVSAYQKTEKKRPRIAFLGGINESKGSRLAFQMIKQDKGKFEWYIIGGTGDPNLTSFEKNNLKKTGWYKREDVGSILQQNQIDLVCILSIWPETFCYTVSEAQLAGVPILATNIGAHGERVKKEGLGWVVDPNASSADILEKIEKIFRNQEDFSAVKNSLQVQRHESISSMAEKYHKLYSGFPTAEKRQRSFDSSAMYHANILGQTDLAGPLDASHTEMMVRINELEATLANVYQSLEYKIMRFLKNEKIPFKSFFKRVLGFGYRIYIKLFKRRK